MSESRERVMQMAEKLVVRGKLSQAIKEYRKLLRHNPNDPSTLNRVGDLYARQDNVGAAVRLFAQIAENYSKDGFFVKSIAIYKKIVRLDPTQIETYGKLAELYHRQGLSNEARSQYQVVADYYLQHGDRQAAIEVHRKMAEVEPRNPSHRVRLAELYLEEGLVEEAIGEYERIAEVMLDHGHVDEAAKVYLRALDVDSQDLAFISEAVIRLREGGHMEAAERVFEAAVERNPEAARLEERMRSHQASMSAAEPQVESGPPAATIDVAEVLSEGAIDPAEPVSGDELDDIAASSELPQPGVTEDGAYLIDIDDAPVEMEEPGGLVAATERPVVVEEVEEPDEIDLDLSELETAVGSAVEAPQEPAEPPAARGALDSIDALEESLGVRRPKAVPAPETTETPAVAVPAAPVPGIRLAELLAEAEVFSKYGLETKAIRRLEQVLEIDGQHVEAHRRLVALSVERGDEGQIVQVAERLLASVPEETSGSFWSEALGRLFEAGFTVEDGKVVRSAPAASTTTAATDVEEEVASGTDTAVEEEEAGLEWLQSSTARQDGPGILFEVEEEFFDLAAELERELAEDDQATEVVDVFPEAVSVEQESLADIVDGFKKGVAEVLSPEAYDTHYNLGIAYREMGLVDEAIGEFQLSAKDPEHLVDSCSMLGACFLEKGFPDLAVKWYKRGLVAEEESLSLLYDLGSVYAISGEREAAYEVFVEIYGVNSHYRDVVARLEELRGD